MTDPATMEEYNERFHAAYRLRGSGEETRVSFPCAFCAEPDWYEIRLVDFGQYMGAHYCIGCGRSARFVFRDLANGVQAELVQCSGPDAPEWMVPTPRREDRHEEPGRSEGYLLPPPPLAPRLRTPPGMRKVDP